MKSSSFIFRIICLLILLSMCLSISAHTHGTIVGRVLNEEGSPLEFAAVSIKQTHRGCHTDENGAFSFFLSPGSYTLQVSYLGGKPQNRSITVTANDTTNIGDVVFKGLDNELTEVVVSGKNRMMQKNTDYVARMPLSYLENPQVYTVVPKELLDIQVVMNMEDALKNITGASNVSRGYGSGGVGVQIMQRGFSSNINMRNGMSTNSLALTDPVNIERIEAIKGPSGTLFGTTVSYGGLVNKVTKKPHERKDFRFAYSGGSWSNNRLTADVNMPLNEKKTLLLRVNTLYASANNYMESVANNKSWAFDPSLTYKVNDRLTLNLDLEIYNNKGLTSFVQITGEKNLHDRYGVTSMKDLNYDWKRSYADRELSSETETFNSFFEAVYKISDKWTSQTAYSHSGTSLKSNYFFLNFITNDSIGRTVNRIPSSFDRDQIQQNFTGEFKIGSMKNRLLVGFDYLHSKNEDTRNSIIVDTVLYNQNTVLLPMQKIEDLLLENMAVRKGYRSSAKVYGTYVSNVLNVTDRFSVLTAVRVDHYRNADYNQTSFSPKFGVVYEIMKNRLSVFGNFLDGFKNNSSGQSDELGTTKNWKPEHATQFEGGVKTQLFDNKLVTTVGVYNVKVRDMLRSIAYVGGSYSQQDGERVSRGFDIDITAQPLMGWTFVAGYGFNNSKLQKMSKNAAGVAPLEGNRPAGVPKHAVNFWTDYRLTQGALKGLGIGVGGNYLSKSFYSDNNYIYNPGRFTTDATVYYGQAKYRVSLKVNNLTDERGWSLGRGAQVVKPREVLGSVTFNL